MFAGHDISFYIAVAGAIVFKLFTSPYKSIPRALLTVFSAIFCAHVFTDPLVHWMQLDPASYTSAVAALLALSGEGVMRVFLTVLGDFNKLKELIQAWRGNK